MRIPYKPSSLFEKDRIRNQIRAQVEDYLRAGGKIRVLPNDDQNLPSGVGRAWGDQEELPRFLT